MFVPKSNYIYRNKTTFDFKKLLFIDNECIKKVFEHS